MKRRRIRKQTNVEVSRIRDTHILRCSGCGGSPREMSEMIVEYTCARCMLKLVPVNPPTAPQGDEKSQIKVRKSKKK
jgi:hypothetical protein